MAGGTIEYKEPSFLKSFVAGGVGGVALLYVGHPLDTIKVRLQTMPQPLPGHPPMFSGALDCIYTTVKKEGVRGLYRGLLSPLVGVTPVYALYFLGYSTGKRLQLKNVDDHLSLPQHFMAGMVGGVYSTPVTAPVERVKCVMQIQQGSKGQVKYSSSWDCARHLCRCGGVASLYQGTMATLLRDIPTGGVYFFTYEWLLQVLSPKDKSHSSREPWRIIFAGGTAGTLCVLICFPFDTLKSIYQTSSKECYPRGVRSVFSEILQEGRMLTLYRGLTPFLIRAFPANAACFLGYEITIKVLNYLFPAL